MLAVLPHASSIALRRFRLGEAPGGARKGVATRVGGSTILETPWTQGVVGAGETVALARCAGVEIEISTPGASLVATSLDSAPIRESTRLLVSAVGRVEPTGARYFDVHRRLTARVGTGPFRVEPVQGSIVWKRPGTAIEAFALDAAGKRISSVAVRSSAEGAKLVIDGSTGILHWELVARPSEAQADARGDGR